MRVINLIGWLGSAAILLAYALVSAKVLQPDSFRYQIINVAGSVGLMINCYASGAMPAAALNLVWLVIGGCVILRQYRNRQQQSR